MKICSKCGAEKAAKGFHGDRCRECEVERSREYYEQNKEKLNAYQREWREQNKEKLNAKKREWRERNREKIRAYDREYNEQNKERLRAQRVEYNEQNKEKINAQMREYYEQNKEKINVQMREYYEQNKEKLNAKKREWRERNREKINAKYYERKKQDHPVTQAKALGCEVCGTVPFHLGAIEFHHIDPAKKSFQLSIHRRADRALAEMAKCVRLCSSCHLTIHGLIPEHGPAGALEKLREMADEIKAHNVRVAVHV